ncbi:acyl-CoA--sterol O-acyltransferase 1-like [Lycium barbarum]|uniref:acyl-CoA--sterol O-acyltransferase 1-like n=1 Tax=Lycium barbarum TaxID=112863 RepID=UPI00293EE817|nr:acyl-CoA--sterol O-acyltransferase 1-like [Lycium barbarum]
MEHNKLMIISFLENPLLVFFLLLLALNYSYFIVSKLPKGIPRILALAPAFYLLYLFPWCFSSALIRGILSFFITWITSFKLILFCFNRGPLSQCKNPIDFILISIFPLKIPREVSQKYEISNGKSVRKASDKPISDGKIPRDVREKYGISNGKSVGKASDKPISNGSPNSLVLSSNSIYARYEVEEIFKQPYLATSFQDFWGRRWNRYSSKMLRLTIYDPTNEALKNLSFVGKNTARVLAIVNTFVVSAIMHELMFYYITCGLCLKPTCEVMWFFILQGICISFERVFQAKNWIIMDPRVSILLKRIFIVFSFYFLLVLPVMREGNNTCEITK